MIVSSLGGEGDVFLRILRRLYWLRNIAIVLQIITLVVIVWWFEIELPEKYLMLIVVALLLLNIGVFLRMQSTEVIPQWEIALNLTLDLSALAGLVYLSGGSSNPFVSMFIVPIALAAAFLSVRYIVWITLLGAFYYSVLMSWYVPLPSIGDRFGGDFNLHIFGMYATFMITAAITAFFVYAVATTGKRYESELSNVREQLMRNEYIVSLGTLAANTAHEINTPLNTIALLSDELKHNHLDSTQVQLDAEEISQQVDFCQKQILTLQRRAESMSDQTSENENLLVAIELMLKQWKAARPEIVVETNLQSSGAIEIPQVNKLMLAVNNLLDNAADASIQNQQHLVVVSLRCVGRLLQLDIDDRGVGMKEGRLNKVAHKPYSSKSDGMGLGLILSHSSLEQIGADLQLIPHKLGGTRARITLEHYCGE